MTSKSLTFKDENHLYYTVLDVFKKLSRHYKHDASMQTALREPPIYIEKPLFGRMFHVIAEQSHSSWANVEYVHKHIVPSINQNPSHWLYLREGRSDPGDKPDDRILLKSSPQFFYPIHLAATLRIPEDDALASIFAQETRAYIQAAAGVTEEEVDIWLINIIGAPEDGCGDINEKIALLARDINKPIGYVKELMLTRSLELKLTQDDDPEKVFDARVGIHWNAYSRIRLPDVLARYPERTHILVSIGAAHLPVFDERTFVHEE